MTEAKKEATAKVKKECYERISRQHDCLQNVITSFRIYEIKINVKNYFQSFLGSISLPVHIVMISGRKRKGTRNHERITV